MARFDVDTSIIAPGKIEIPLVRADLISTSTTFRVLFDIFLSISMTLFGMMISSETAISSMHKGFFAVTVIATITFLVLDVYWQYRARH